MAEAVEAGEFAGRSIGEGGEMLWVFNSAQVSGARFWLSVVSSFPVSPEKLRGVANAVASLKAGEPVQG